MHLAQDRGVRVGLAITCFVSRARRFALHCLPLPSFTLHCRPVGYSPVGAFESKSGRFAIFETCLGCQFVKQRAES